MKTPTDKKAPPFDGAHMELRTGITRELPVRADLAAIHDNARLASTVWSDAQDEYDEAAELLSEAKTAEKAADKELQAALVTVKKRLQELKSGLIVEDVEIVQHFDWSQNVVREVRVDEGFEGVLLDERAMTDDERSDLLAGTGKGKAPTSDAPVARVGDMEEHIQCAHDHRGRGAHDRNAFIADVMDYDPRYTKGDVKAGVDAFLAARHVERVVLVDVAEWLANDTVVASDGYKGDTHEEMVDLLAGDVFKDIKTVMVDGVECEVDLDQIRDAVEITVTRGQRDLVVSKLEDEVGTPLSKTTKALAKASGLDVKRVKLLLASAKKDGLVDKPKGKQSWVRLPAPALPPLDPEETALAPGEFAGEEFDAAMLAEGPARDRVIAKLVAHLPSKNELPLSAKNPQALANDTGVHLLHVGKLLGWAQDAGLAGKRKGTRNGWMRLAAVEDEKAPAPV